MSTYNGGNFNNEEFVNVFKSPKDFKIKYVFYFILLSVFLLVRMEQSFFFNEYQNQNAENTTIVKNEYLNNKKEAVSFSLKLGFKNANDMFIEKRGFLMNKLDEINYYFIAYFIFATPFLFIGRRRNLKEKSCNKIIKTV